MFFIYHQLMDIWVVSILWLLWITLQKTFLYKFLCGRMISFLLGIYLGVELLGLMVTLCLIVWGTARLFSRMAALFYISTSSVWGFWFVHILAKTYFPLNFFFLIITIQVVVKWSLIVVLIFIFFITNEVGHLFMCLLAICISSL